MTKIRNRALSKIGKCLLATLLPVTGAYADGHPKFYVDKGACPFECCTYRAWTAKKSVKLYAKPKTGSRAVGWIKKGSVVNASTGEVHTAPGKLVVRRDVSAFKKNDVLWIYTYLGEGFFKVWHGGGFVETEIPFDPRSRSADDWGHFVALPDSVWWVKVKTAAGLEGWSNQADSFDNKDACG